VVHRSVGAPAYVSKLIVRCEKSRTGDGASILKASKERVPLLEVIPSNRAQDLFKLPQTVTSLYEIQRPDRIETFSQSSNRWVRV
jgi:hypothetical protein